MAVFGWVSGAALAARREGCGTALLWLPTSCASVSGAGQRKPRDRFERCILDVDFHRNMDSRGEVISFVIMAHKTKKN